MGTNYYAIMRNCECCKCDKRNSLHIGKSSGGWRFLLHAREGLFETIDDYLNHPLFDYIENEYGETVSKEEILELIQAKKEHKDHLNLSYDKFIKLQDYDVCYNDFS